MNRSPLTLRRINKLIGQAMRYIQLTDIEFVQIHMRSAIRWLNRARARIKSGKDATLCLQFAAEDMRSASNSKTNWA